MDDESIAWTSFRTLEPNPYPYTPMTQSILKKGVKTSAIVRAVRQESPITQFHNGYLYINVDEITRILNDFANFPVDILIKYFRDDAKLDLDQIALRPSWAGLKSLPKLGYLCNRAIFRGLSANCRLPNKPPVDDLTDAELRSVMNAHLEYLVRMVSAHVIFSILAEAYAVGIERFAPGSPSRQRIQEIISISTNSKTSEMARWAANLESDEQRDEFLEVFGHRCPREMEIAIPRWADDSSTLHKASPNSKSSPEDTSSSDQLSGKLARLSLYPGSLLERLRENPKNEWLKSYGYLRRTLLEVGRRATKSAHLQKPTDIFYISWETAQALLDDPPSRNHTQERVVNAKKRHDQNKNYIPSLFLDDHFRPVKQQRSAQEKGKIRGLGVSGGKVSGCAVTAQSIEEVNISDDSESQILVTEFTDAGWTPLFFQVDGLVMERGSLLSHGSIVAREAGIPAVVNTTDALDRIESGDCIEVNADEGFVRFPES